MIKNPSFEEGWKDVSIITQEPAHWSLNCLEVGATLYGGADVVQTEPECVHKLARQLPPEERPDGKKPLILDGDQVYKMFAAGGAWGATLHQLVKGLEPGSEYTVTVPFQFHNHGEGDPWAAEFKLALNGEGNWRQLGVVGNSLRDHHWNRARATATVPEDGTVRVELFAKAKYGGVDLFIDNITDSKEARQRGTPREQYSRTYVLLPPEADSAWARAAVKATWDEKRYTIGGSADDAGIGDLDDRTVIAINPARWPTDLEEFFQTHYPRVRYTAVGADTPEQLATKLRSIDL